MVSIIIISIVAMKVYKTTNRASAISMQHLEDGQITKTLIAAHMEEKIKENVNLLYCLSFQLCWDEMINYVNGDIRLDKDTPIVSYLNNGLSSKVDISEDSYVAASGCKKDNIESIINDQLSSKFDNSKLVDFSSLSDDDLIAYAYLYKNLKFAKEFESMESPLDFNEKDNKVEVKAFGIKDYSDKNKEMGKQVDIIDYKNEDDFILRLKTKSPNEEIILAKVKPGDTLLDTILLVNERINNNSIEALSKHDVLMIPKFSFDITHRYSELIGGNILNKGFSGYSIIEAMQNITFVLDEKGAILKSTSFMVATKSAYESKYLTFNHPFLLYMKEKDAQYPYFAMWVENTELMSSY